MTVAMPSDRRKAQCTAVGELEKNLTVLLVSQERDKVCKVS